MTLEVVREPSLGLSWQEVLVDVDDEVIRFKSIGLSRCRAHDFPGTVKERLCGIEIAVLAGTAGRNPDRDERGGTTRDDCSKRATLENPAKAGSHEGGSGSHESGYCLSA